MRCLAAGAFAKALLGRGRCAMSKRRSPRRASQKCIGVSVKHVFNPRLRRRTSERQRAGGATKLKERPGASLGCGGVRPQKSGKNGDNEMGFAFDEGQCVHHRSGGMASIVVSRERTARGREHYRLWDIKPTEARRERWFAGDYLRATEKGGKECQGCPLADWCLQ